MDSILRTIVAGALLLTLGACSTPQSVKSLSTAQLQALHSYQGHLGQYFGKIEQLTQSQIALAEEQLDELTNGILALRRKEAAARLEAATQPTRSSRTAQSAWSPQPIPIGAGSPALVEFTDQVKAELGSASALKAQLQDRKGSLVAAHQNFVTSFQTLLEAQKRIDQFVQSQWTDEVVFNELLVSVGRTRENFAKAVAQVSDAVAGMNETVDKVKALKK